MEIQAFVVSPIGSNCYVVSTHANDGASAVIIDPGDLALEPVFAYVASRRLRVQAVWNTHAHFDHVMGVDVVRRKLGVPAFVHAADLPIWDNLAESTKTWLGRTVEPLAAPDVLWHGQEEIFLDDTRFAVIHTPGHSPGSVCFVGDKVAFTGDTLFRGSIGRTDLWLSDSEAMQSSLNLLRTLPDELVIYPGHMGHSTMAAEKANNPFLREGSADWS